MMNIAAIDPVAFDIFGWPIRWYGIFIGAAILLALTFASRDFRRKGWDEEFILDSAVWTILIGFIGARVYYVLFELDYYLQNPGEILQIWNGGIAIYGGVIAGGLTLYFYAKSKKMDPLFVTDTVAPYLLLAQAIGRWGNFVNQEAHGGEVTLEFLQDTLHLPQFIVDGMHIDGAYYHPTFLYESVWNILGVAVLLFVRSRNKTLRIGDTTLLYLIWYPFGRFFIEGLRTDSLWWGPFRVSQVLSAVLFIGALLIFAARRMNDKYYEYYSEHNGPAYKSSK
ncbi:prolipoprotein diacylglyceryl transferase [Aerococcus viridans]|uniref:Phosphatidylglycerol--prolipoprotein diacylglyceryl transferase n=2 Tax=Aerococcus viridans TaxID=1377 RepID=A0AAU8U752_9LACT|nr:prolipoprotein diacylglyceryl transferase [Aerococcus viridans]AMC01730.1 prolipoprotein diacylglyceryl transferase [Aerococcus viridans]EFG49029.1 prolipoprotein diacylglyceryl transferase [Aerococcus viridans ATCC 11563 = CCUG 4311]